MVKRRRRQYPSRGVYGGSISKRLIGRLVVLVVLVIAVYYAYPPVIEFFSGSGGDSQNTPVEDAGTAAESDQENAPKPAEAKPEVVQSQEPQLAVGSIQVEVLNGCGVAGLASRVTDSLRTRGFDVVKTGNFQSKNVSETLVILRSTKKGAAQIVADYLGTKNVVAQTALDLMLDVTVVLGHDHRNLNIFK